MAFWLRKRVNPIQYSDSFVAVDVPVVVEAILHQIDQICFRLSVHFYVLQGNEVLVGGRCLLRGCLRFSVLFLKLPMTKSWRSDVSCFGAPAASVWENVFQRRNSFERNPSLCHKTITSHCKCASRQTGVTKIAFHLV